MLAMEDVCFMKQFIECMPCYLTQVISALKLTDIYEKQQSDIVKEETKINSEIHPE